MCLLYVLQVVKIDTQKLCTCCMLCLQLVTASGWVSSWGMRPTPSRDVRGLGELAAYISDTIKTALNAQDMPPADLHRLQAVLHHAWCSGALLYSTVSQCHILLSSTLLLQESDVLCNDARSSEQAKSELQRSMVQIRAVLRRCLSLQSNRSLAWMKIRMTVSA